MTFVHQASTCQSLLRPFFTGYYTCLLKQEGGEELSNNTHTHTLIYTQTYRHVHIQVNTTGLTDYTMLMAHV